MREHLKIKLKSLAAEARMIRLEERRVVKPRRKMKKMLKAKVKEGVLTVGEKLKIIEDKAKQYEAREYMRVSVYLHRVNEVRPKTRATQVAYGFVIGLSFDKMEQKTRPDRRKLDWAMVERLVEKYGEGDIRDRMQRFSEWKASAQAAS